MKKKYILQNVFWGACFQGVFSLLILILLTANSVYMLDYIIGGIGILEGIVFAFWTYKKIYLPVKALNKAYRAFAGGYMAYDLFGQKLELNREHDEMMQRMHKMLEQKELVQLYRSQAEYLALQNQINPHFLYNTLEGIRSEALIGGLPLVGEMAEVLAKFFRYTISNVRTMVTIEDEIRNVQHYCQIQKFRFGDKISMKLLFMDEDEERIRKCRTPKLILQPIVENAIRHGIEPLVGNGEITIRFQVISKRLLLVVSDNGVGMKEEKLRKLNKKLGRIQLEETEATGKTGGIAMVNVNNRIKLLFGENYGIHFYSTDGLGTEVEISLPYEDDSLGQVTK